jgi:hypothetical protein
MQVFLGAVSGAHTSLPVQAPGVTVAPVHSRVFVAHDGACVFTAPFVTVHEAPTVDGMLLITYSDPFGVEGLQELTVEPMYPLLSALPEQSVVEKAL